MKHLFWFLPFVLVGCASYADLGNGRYAKTAFSEHRSPVGTNGGFMRLESCPGEAPGVFENRPAPKCDPLTEWVPVSSQGQGGQIAAGLLQAGGLLGLGALMPANGAAATQSQSVTVPAPRGHR
jgi:hypothetical protein